MANRRTLLVLVGTIGAVAAAAAIWIVGGADPDPLIAEVDGIPIRQSQADSRIEGIASIHGDITTTLGSEWRATVLQSLVDDVIVQIEADRRSLEPTDADLEQAVADTKAMVGTDADWEIWLTDQGLDDEEVERRLTTQIRTNRVYDAVTADVTIARTDLEAYYEANLDQFTVDGAVRELSEVEEQIKVAVESMMRDRVYAEWIDARRAEVILEVVHDDWR